MWISGSGLGRDYAERSGRRCRGEEIVAAAAGGEPAAKAAFDAYVERLGRALAGVVHLIDPDVIVLGGGMSNVDALYARLPDAIRAHVFGGEWDAPLRQARWGDSSGVRGAARLWE
jgi:fructokinase